MKRILKGAEPENLINYRNTNPDATWQEMQKDLSLNGQQASLDCRAQTISDQKGLCAFCEIDISGNNPLKCRIEHFHPKSDNTNQHNWALDWQNMLAVCNGGSRPEISDASFHMPPINENLSCDAHKDRMIQSGKLPENCEGWILNPLQLKAFPTLFRIEKSSGRITPDPASCMVCEPWSNNHHSNLENLVEHTITMLNLNCDRLKEARLKVIRNIEHNKKKQRQKGLSPKQGLENLAQRYFRKQWPGFFTTIYLCLGTAAETYLKNVSFQG
ncbi:MAG: retron system putative HNH endonuclease [Pseudomonadota bacterium]|nr:retron system putative HNH endonuclease [Pseudomonadota bacterium]